MSMVLGRPSNEGPPALVTEIARAEACIVDPRDGEAALEVLKQGAAYGYTRVLGLHPLLATQADTGEVLDVR
jgi:hypothetical protein